MRAWRVVAAACAALLLAAGAGRAHPPPPPLQARELIRLQGHRRPGGAAPAGRLELTALGRAHVFAATVRAAYSLTAAEATTPATRYTLQGPRPLLARFADARPDQLVTILAEHRAGSVDLFLLALDLCPPQ